FFLALNFMFSLHSLTADDIRSDPEVETIESVAQVLTSILKQPKVQAEASLILLDLDETLVEPAQPFGSENWYRLMFEFFRQHGKTKTEALKMTEIVWYLRQSQEEIRWIEPGVQTIFEKILSHGARL